MKKDIRKRVYTVALAATMIINSLQLPGGAMQAVAREINIEDSENTETESDIDEESTLSQFIHIGQIADMDELPEPDDSDCIYDAPILLNTSSKVRIFANYGIDIKYPDEGMLTWSILRGEAETVPGTTNLVNAEDDWTDFETVPSSPWFTMEEEEDENSSFYKTLTVTANEMKTDEDCENYDYYIRATFQYVADQNECIAVTTVPVILTTTEHEEESTTDAEEETADVGVGTEQETAGDETEEETAGNETEEETADNGTEQETIDNETEQETAGDETEEETTDNESEEETTTAETEEESTTVETEEESVTESEKDETITGPAEDETDVTDATDEYQDGELESESATETEPDVADTETDAEPSTEENSGQESDESSTIVTGVSKLTLNKTSATMNPGDTLKPTVTITPEGLNLNVTWSSSNSEVATVNDSGTITALAEGRAQITAECGGKSANIVIDVVKTDAEKNNDTPKDEDGNIIAISDEIWIAGFERESDTLIYTGNKITQNLRIYHKGTILKEKTDYVLTYKNNVNAAAYNSEKAPSVTITMKGQYTGSRTLYFTIAPREIDENESLGYEQVIQYSKNLKIPAPTLYYGSKKLVLNKDFSCDYSSLPENYTKGDSYEEGVVYEYTVNGMGNFKGSVTMNLTVIKNKNLNLSNAVITLGKKQYEYHGSPLSASEVKITSVKINKSILDAGLYEYKVCADGVGTGYVEVYPSAAGRSAGYRGMKQLKFKVVGDRNIKDAQTGNGWQDTIIFSKKTLDNYGGICQEKTEILSWGKGDSKETLTEGVDYTVKYTNNKNVGTATVIFTGMGRYKGSFKKTYKILPDTDLYIKWYNTDDNGMPIVSYMKGGAIPKFDLLDSSESEEAYVLSSKTDYTVKIKNNKKPGIMTCEITGKGNYKGYKSITEVEVVSADISQGTISVKDKQYSKKANAWKSAVTITDVNGKKLTAGTDYDKKLIYSYEGMENEQVPEAGTIVYVTALGINNYEGSSITGSYRIYSMNISKLTVLIDAQEYTGKEIELSAEDIHVYASKSDVKKGIEIAEPCYEIVSYSNNVKAGKAKVTLRGIGDYGGTKTYSFKIVKKAYLTTRVTGISLNESSIALGAGNSRQLTATILPEDASNKTVIWTTSNSKIASVSADGIVTAINPGTVTIRATAQDTGKKASCKVKVSIIPVTSFSLNAEEVKQSEGTQYQLTATEIQPADATYSTILWESTNPETASVDANGKISLKKAGMAVIKAYTTDKQFVRKCLVFVEGKDETVPEGTYLTPQMFRTADEDDDTKSFNTAIKNISTECNTVYIPAGTYKIDAQTGIRLKSNMNFVMSPDAVLQAADNSSKIYNVIYVSNIRNVTISGGQIIGERYGHDGSAGEWGMGIGVYDSTDIHIDNIRISNCFGDGIYIGSEHEEDAGAGCSRITVTNCNVYNNRRNNMSIVCADYVTVDNCTFDDANGTAPEYGIDIEPNIYSNPCEHITISNSTFNGNAQASIGIVTSANDVMISGCTLNGNFINYAGTNVTISNSTINAKMYARIGVSLINGTKINDGSSEEDILVASFSAGEGPYTIGEYGINDSNLMSCSIIDDSDSPSGKALCLKRQTKGTKEAGCYLNLSELMGGSASVLEKGATYRFEYVVKGSGQWGIKTSQTCWYPCAPMSDKFSTGITTYTAGSAKSCKVFLYAVDMTKNMYLEVDSITIYKVR